METPIRVWVILVPRYEGGRQSSLLLSLDASINETRPLQACRASGGYMPLSGKEEATAVRRKKEREREAEIDRQIHK